MIRLAVRCRPGQAEFVLAELAVLAPHGVEETRVTTGEGASAGERGEPGEELVEYAIYGGPGEVPEIGELEAVIGGELVEVVAEEVPDDWSERWREFHQPVLVGGRVWVRPPWSDRHPDLTVDEHAGRVADAVVGEVIDLVVDPGRAFGTGAHQTTRLCLEAMLAHVERAGRGSEPGGVGAFADFGTGSGVLAIAAAKLGFYPVWAYDHDPAAVDAARENAAANQVEINLARVDLRIGIPPFAPLTVANLVAPMLIDLAERLEPDNLPGTLVCSGILPEQTDEVATAFAPAGLSETARATDTAWSALTLARAT